MKSTTVDSRGQVHCPKCGATDFTDKRTVKGKVLGGLLAPKRLVCRGCGTALKKAGGESTVAPAQPVVLEMDRQRPPDEDRPSRDSFRR